MAGEAVAKYGTQKTLEANGASCANGAYVKADDASVSETDTLDYRDAEFALTLTFAVAPAAGQAIILFVQPLDVDGTADTPDPSANYQKHYAATFTPNAVATSQTLWAPANAPLPRRYFAWFGNRAGQSINAGWVLKMTPRTIGPAA
jgi:hypothetical protein